MVGEVRAQHIRACEMDTIADDGPPWYLAAIAFMDRILGMELSQNVSESIG
jgi:hypothetical protein